MSSLGEVFSSCGGMRAYDSCHKYGCFVLAKSKKQTLYAVVCKHGACECSECLHTTTAGS
ncbi:hypothetical protein IV72_GL000509 [Atopobium minutum]|nr:hypothetical protein HMPREF1247_1341 [Atopobium sp. BV3Ac4]KRN55013.1 hypothetical protein IV72_GL000509 [Atopobium minutum]